MPVYQVAVNNKKFWIGIEAGFLSSPPKNLQGVLEVVSKICDKIGASITLVDPSIIVSDIQCILAIRNALTAFSKGRNLSKKLEIEILIRLSGQRQIKDAIDMAAPKDPVKELVLLAVAQDKHIVEATISEVIRQLNISVDKRLLRIDPGKEKLIMNKYGIDPDELEATYAEDREEALVKCVLSRMAELEVKIKLLKRKSGFI